MMFFDDIGISKRETVSLRAGCYSFTLYHLGRHPSGATAIGLFGSDHWPRIIFVLQPAQEPQTTPSERVPNLVRLNTADWVTEPAVNALCVATITKVSDGFVTLELHLTSSTRSGYGRMPIPAKTSIKPDQDVVVRLRTDEGAYWSAEFVSKA